MTARPATTIDLTTAPHPVVYEINTWPWLHAMASRQGAAVDLGSVPDRHWDDLAGLGCDAVWLMGVWQRSPAGTAIALANEQLKSSFSAALPDWQPADVVGSPYCVRDYVVDAHLGGPRGLAIAREALRSRGLGLILDFVPNHVAPDHPWTTTNPDLFVVGTDEQLEQDPASFVRVGDRILANGRDPYFPAWPDVVQLNAFAPELRAAVDQTLRRIAEQCDGVRCDMAMLAMNEVFAQTWCGFVGPTPETDFWPTVIQAVRQEHPRFVFLAEAYWDREWDLQQQGFDFCYDKRLYDRLLDGTADQVDGHLHADPDYQRRLVRFVENHDEPRATTAFGYERSKVAAITALTQTGLRLLHHGQLTGSQVHLPVFLRRYPDEPTDTALEAFRQAFLPVLTDPTLRHGEWRLCRRSGWPGDDRFHALVSWCWTGEHRWLIAVNLSDSTAAGRIQPPWEDLRGQAWRLVDPTQHTHFVRSGNDLADGLFVQLPPWGWHLLRVEPTTEPAAAR
ncbi:MAG TPA: alpha-amylase family glycosyl hydrolase [Microlunatus sp.]